MECSASHGYKAEAMSKMQLFLASFALTNTSYRAEMTPPK